jgi:adenylate kinase
MAFYIVLLGPPGAGKGTQAQRISERYKLPHISSGDLFRENIKNGTELGVLAKSFMNRGELVPDDVTIAMVRDRLLRPDCKLGALLDGFPRTVPQAQALDKMLLELHGKIDAVPYIQVAERVLVDRLSGRWICRAEGHVYHEKNQPPQQVGVCDLDGSLLYQREDDKVETVLQRIQVYMEQTAPLITYYRQQGTLLEVDGARSIDQVGADLFADLDERIR